ncbi:uncharacterized protein LOC114929874 isoform X2 [Nylanderia fulva]|uniref:uncharacterized protein LOC114929874 isoform X2 n=1 Tax=Nylanderia fulva TaxID=613905 RepID=UPI0010FB8AD7|nr:uncharacterized protein LOC114929874 isoform X2 [Nylanderia fulva]
MEESANSNEMELENAESSDLIISDIKQFATLRDSIKMFDRQAQRLNKHTLNLVESNHNIERNVDKLEQNMVKHDAKIMTTAKLHVEKKQELMDLQNAKANISHKEWDNCLSKIGKYADSFSQWITEYSRDTLMKHIEGYQKECKKVSDELTILKREVDDAIRKYDLNYIEANVDVDDLPSFDSVEQQ